MIQSIYKYLGEIRPARSDFEYFVTQFDSPDISIWKNQNESSSNIYTFTSIHLNDCEDHISAKNRLASLKTIFDGAMLIFFDREYLCFDVRINNYDGEQFYLDHSDPDITVYPFSESYINSCITYEEYCNLHSSRVSEAIFLSRYDEVTRDILKYVGHQKITYITLYAIKDWFLKNGWDMARILKETKWSNSTFSRFTKTANNPVYSGPYCRHGGTHEMKRPSEPMSLNEAAQPILSALKIFIIERFLQMNLEGRLKGNTHLPIDTTK